MNRNLNRRHSRLESLIGAGLFAFGLTMCALPFFEPPHPPVVAHATFVRSVAPTPRLDIGVPMLAPSVVPARDHEEKVARCNCPVDIAQEVRRLHAVCEG